MKQYKSLVHQLRAHGIRVKITHTRPYYFLRAGGVDKVLMTKYQAKLAKKDVSRIELCPTGGRTTVIIGPDGSNAIGIESKCSNKENFSYKTGVEMALCKIFKCKREELQESVNYYCEKPQHIFLLADIREKMSEIGKSPSEIVMQHLKKAAE